jgi:hypothetical protein
MPVKGRRYFPRKSLKRASSTMCSVDKTALTRRGVNFIQMTLRFAKLHKLLDALVEGDTITDQIGTRAERGANALLID